MMIRAWPFLEVAIKSMVNSDGLPQCLQIADLGCSYTAPNTITVFSNVIKSFYVHCKQNKLMVPEFQVFLNDLPSRCDFNSIFRSWPEFYAKILTGVGDDSGPCFVCGVPGSLYERLFPKETMNFIHCSNGLHWLSQVPDGIESNKHNMYLAKTSPQEVYEAYMKQFQSDFSKFLRLRSEEMISGGRMVLAFEGRCVADPIGRGCCNMFEQLSESLLDMVNEGLVEEADVNAFNFPFYTPYKDEVMDIIENEGSFAIDEMQVFGIPWVAEEGQDEKKISLDEVGVAQDVAKKIRDFSESTLAGHFAGRIIDNLFERYTKRLAEYLRVEKPKYFDIVISLTKN